MIALAGVARCITFRSFRTGYVSQEAAGYREILRHTLDAEVVKAPR